MRTIVGQTKDIILIGVKKALADANYTYILVRKYLSCTIHVAVSVNLEFCFHIYLFLFIHGF